MTTCGVGGIVCAWSTVSPGCGTTLPEVEDTVSLSVIKDLVVRTWLTQGRSCRLAKRRHTLGNISLRVWPTGRGSIVEVLLVGGLALEIGLAQLY